MTLDEAIVRSGDDVRTRNEERAAQRMTKKEIVRRIAREQDLKQVQVKEMVQMTLDLIVRALCEEGRIELRNFGVFEVKIRAPRKARNPRTGEPIQVPAKTTVRFKPGKKMRELVQQSTY